MAKLTVSRFKNLGETRLHYLNEVDRRAEAERGRYITPGAGQAMTYEAKHREALAGGGPLLQAEAQALGMSVDQVASTVIAAHEAWLTIGATIESARLRAKRDIRQAETAAEMHAAVKALAFN